MPEGGLIAWFLSLSIWTQIFYGLFVVFIAFPMATLTVMQFLESLRSSRETTRKYAKPQDEDENERK